MVVVVVIVVVSVVVALAADMLVAVGVVLAMAVVISENGSSSDRSSRSRSSSRSWRVCVCVWSGHSFLCFVFSFQGEGSRTHASNPSSPPFGFRGKAVAPIVLSSYRPTPTCYPRPRLPDRYCSLLRFRRRSNTGPSLGAYPHARGRPRLR